MELTQTTGLSRARIQSYAEKIAPYHGIPESDRPDIATLVQKLGGSLHISDSADLALTIRAQGDFTISIGHLTSWSSDRYTIATQLGHYFLHYRYFSLNEKPHDPYEVRRSEHRRLRQGIEATQFARALLIPSVRFVDPEETENSALATRFQVPVEVIALRVQDFAS